MFHDENVSKRPWFVDGSIFEGEEALLLLNVFDKGAASA
jgi:hypothetical protein